MYKVTKSIGCVYFTNFFDQKANANFVNFAVGMKNTLKYPQSALSLSAQAQARNLTWATAGCA